ncbi:MAG: DMT family transporter [Deltaproteobacteria bacterium]|jgi:drug/metabolite transporter (DMT)-like permease|nr:DMT family transporter [Deltaproteobacteria bacterium]
MKIWQADLAILLAGSLWGFSYLFSRWGLADCSPALFMFCRVLVASLVGLALMWKMIRRTSRAVLKEGLILGALTGSGYLLQVYSINFTTVARASFLTGMCLVGIPVLSYILFRQVVRPHSLVGVIIAVIGLYVFLDPTFGGVNPGDVIGLIAIPAWALYMIYMSVYTEGKTDPDVTYQFLFWQLTAILPLALITFLVFESGLILAPLHPDLGKGLTITPSFLLGVGFTAVLGTLAPVFLHTRSQKYTTAVQAMICFQFEPVTAMVASYFILSEPMNTRTVVGAAIIVAAVVVSETGGYFTDSRRKPPA